MNQADLFRAALRVPYMRTRRYHDADIQHLATFGERLADDYDRLAAEVERLRHGSQALRAAIIELQKVAL